MEPGASAPQEPHPQEPRPEGPEQPARAKEADAPAEEPKKPPSPPDLGRKDVHDYQEIRDRILLGDDGVVYAYCNISAESFTGRDSRADETGELIGAQVRADYLKKLDDVYEPPDCAAAAGDRLRSEGVLPVQGRRGNGRTAFAIQVLRPFVASEVWLIRPGTPVAELSEARFVKGRGYLLAVGTHDVVSDFEMTRLRGLCEKRGCYLVLIFSAGVQAAAPGWLQLDRPRVPLHDLLFRHAVRNLAEDRHDQVRKLLGRPELAEWCDGDHALSELEAVAGVLNDVVRDRIRIEALAKHFDLLGGEKIRAWFDDSQAVALRSLKIALGFFGGLPLQTVLDIEDRLTVLLRQASGEKEPRDLFKVSARDRLEAVSAIVAPREHTDSFGVVRTDVVEFADISWETGLTRLLRAEYPAVRPVLIAWLRELAAHPDPQVQRRAALMLGYFAEDSLETLYHEVMLPWACTSDDRLHLLVVMALTVPLADAEVAPRVLHIVREWADSDDFNRISVSATVYGLVLAPANTRAALDGLARIARRQRNRPGLQEAAVGAAAGGIFAMYLNDSVDDKLILEALLRWSRSRKRSERDFAVFAFLFIGDSVTETAWRGPGRPRRHWPTLLRAFADPVRSQAAVDLLQEALNNVEWSEQTIKVLQSWFLRANKNPYLVRPLTDLVVALCTTRSEAERLAHHLEAWAWKHPEGAAAQVRRKLWPSTNGVLQ